MPLGKNYVVTYHRDSAGEPVLDRVVIKTFTYATVVEAPAILSFNEHRGQAVTVILPNNESNDLGLDFASLGYILSAAAFTDGATSLNPTSLSDARIEGVGTIGQALTVMFNGAWFGPGPLTFSYAWASNAVYVPDETGSSLIVGSGESGRTIVCVVTATNTYGSTEVTSNGIHIS